MHLSERIFPGGGKCRDKLFAFTSVVRCSKLKVTVMVMLDRKEACRRVRVVCKWCSWAGFVSSLKTKPWIIICKQRQGKPVKSLCQIMVCKKLKLLIKYKESLQKRGQLRQAVSSHEDHVMLIVKSRIDHDVLPQWGQGKRLEKESLQLFITEPFITPNGTAIK